MSVSHKAVHRSRGKSLGLPELIAIALGGMIGGGIFTILGISVAMIGVFTPLAIVLGGMIAALAAYSYVKLGVYYQDEGATYAFFKKTFPNSPFTAALIGWWIVFGYISTLSLYAYTFAAYALSGSEFASTEWLRKLVASAVIMVFTAINLWSVKGMGKIEDLMVYTKLLILVGISFVLMRHGQTSVSELLTTHAEFNVLSIFIVASITFVAYEGFQLVINAANEMTDPQRNIPRAIYSAIAITIVIYVVIAVGAILAIPFADIIQNKEYALAAGAGHILGGWGSGLVILGALLATSSAISGTVFGASRQMAVIAVDGYFPTLLAKRRQQIPVHAIICMALFAIVLIVIGDLELILEFGSVTFLLVSLLMAYANFKIRHLTSSSMLLTLLACLGLLAGTLFILFFEYSQQPQQLLFILSLYVLLTLGAWIYARTKSL